MAFKWGENEKHRKLGKVAGHDPAPTDISSNVSKVLPEDLEPGTGTVALHSLYRQSCQRVLVQHLCEVQVPNTTRQHEPVQITTVWMNHLTTHTTQDSKAIWFLLSKTLPSQLASLSWVEESRTRVHQTLVVCLFVPLLFPDAFHLKGENKPTDHHHHY